MGFAPEPGARLGRYELRRPLGKGGMGEVWEAVFAGPSGFRKPVALKLLTQRGGDAESDFLREARLGALVQHPNVVATLDLLRVEDTVAIAMELVQGATGSELLRSGPLSAVALVDLGLQVAAGLHHIHHLRVDDRQVGLVHRDLKPSNVIVDRSGVARLLDLGVSRLVGTVGQVSGTPGYMAPEQARGEDEPRSDLFALGAVLWSLAVGEAPFGRGPTAMLQIQAVEHKLGDGRFLRRADERLPGLGEVIRSCLRADPAQRFPDAAALGAALAQLRPRASGATLLEALGQARPELRVEVTGSFPSVGSGPPTVALELGNLPAARDRFVGRTEDVVAVVDRLRGPDRLVTLLGPGGMGKTRTSLEAARTVRAELPGGAWFVDLSAATDAAGMCHAVAEALAVKLERGDPVATLGFALASRERTLLVLDNLEQGIDAFAPVVGRWAERAPEVTFLCTSRIALRLRGEVRHPLGPLGPEEGAALFLERAARRPEPAELDDVRALVVELDGLPLALELAAARTRVLKVAEIRRRLADRWRLLTATDRDRPDRHRSVRASLDGSHELLSPAARSAFAQLSVFEGGFTPEAAEAVVDLSAEDGLAWVLDTVVELADHSLLRTGADGDRFEMLVAVREYASEKLGSSASDPEMRHAAWFAQLGSEAALGALRGRGSERWTARLTAESANLQAAARRALARGDVATAVPLVRAAAESLGFTGPSGPDLELLTRALALPIPDETRVVLEIHHAEAACRAGSPAEAIPRLERLSARLSPALRARLDGVLALALFDTGRTREALEAGSRSRDLARSIGDGWLEASAELHVGQTLLTLGRSRECLQGLARAVALFRANGSPRDEGRVLSKLAAAHLDLGQQPVALQELVRAVQLMRVHGSRRDHALATCTLATCLGQLGRGAEAIGLLEQALATFRALGDRQQEGLVLGNLGTVRRDTGDPVQAEVDLLRAVELLGEAGNKRLQGVFLGNLGLAVSEQGREEESVALLRRALALHREVGNRRSEAVVLSNLVHSHTDPVERLARLREVLAMHRELNNRRFEGVTLGQLGDELREAGRYAEARAALEEGLKVCEACGNRRHVGLLQRHLGSLASAEGDEEGARRWYELALEVHREVEDQRSEAITGRHLAEVLLDLGQLEDALRVTERSVALSERTRDEATLALALGTQARIAAAAGRHDDARSTLSRALAATDAHAEAKASLLLVQATLARDQGDEVTARLSVDEARRLVDQRRVEPSSTVGRAVLAAEGR